MTKRNITWLGSFTLCAAVALIGTAVSAAPAKSTKRDDAIRECVALAKAENPQLVITGQAADPSGAAMAVYKDCMRKKGMRP